MNLLTQAEIEALKVGGPGWCGSESFDRLCDMALAQAEGPKSGDVVLDEAFRIAERSKDRTDNEGFLARQLLRLAQAQSARVPEGWPKLMERAASVLGCSEFPTDRWLAEEIKTALAAAPAHGEKDK